VALPTYGNLVDSVRREVQDLDEDRYDNVRILDALNLATLEIRRLRPDFFIGRYAEPVFVARVLTDEYPYNEMSIPIVIKYAVGWIETADDEYTNDGRAVAMLGMFKDDLTT
jgi:hypothetical protein